MEEVNLRVDIERGLKEEAMSKAKAEGKSMKYVITELLSSYVRGEQDQVKLTFRPSTRQSKEEVQTTTPNQLRPEDFDNHLDYVDYLEKNGLID